MGLTERIARACALRPGRTFLAWGIALLACIAAVVLLLGGLSTDDEATNDPESYRAAAAYARAFPPDPGRIVTDVVVVRSERYSDGDAEFESFLAELERDGRRTRAIAGRQPATVSRDRHAVLIPLFVRGEEDVARLVEVVERADEHDDFAVAITGNQTFDHDFGTLSQRDLEEGELKFGMPAALVIVLLVFGSVVAGVIPLLMAVVSIIGALGLVALLSQVVELSIFITNMLIGMGLALGIDYALFVISRYREERGGGREPVDAIAGAGATANRAVLFSGSAFVVAMFGMLLVPSSIMRSLAAGAILVGIVSVLAALTLLPAVLGALRDRVDGLRLPVVGRRSLDGANAEGRFWRAVVDAVLRRPALSLALSTALLVAATIPFFGMQVGTFGVSVLPDDLPSRKGYAAVQRDFGERSTDPVQIVVERPTTEARTALEQLRERLGGDARFGPGEIREANGVAVLEAPVRGDEVSEEAVAAVRELRREVVPEAFRDTGSRALVGGSTSENVDYFDSVTDPAPYVFAFVLGLTFVLLTIAFRSIAIAGSAILLNLLSVGAAYGLLVLVFQHGFGAGLLGFEQVEAIEAWVPLFLFSVLFGLSMDYQVFLLSRIRERYDQTRDTREAVRWGVASTAKIITGAALIIVAVFSGFARGDLVMFQQMGFGVAVALLIDATLIRSVLMPSLLALLGDRSWFLPRWLGWLPHLEVEGHAARAESE